MHLDDTVNFVVGQVCQRDIVAEQEGELLVVILKIEWLPHTGRQLVNKAEHAVIGAAVLFVAQIGLKLQPSGSYSALVICTVWCCSFSHTSRENDVGVV